MAYKDIEVRRAKTAERLRRLRQKPGYTKAKNLRWKEKNREKYLAHKAVEYALKTGKLVRGPCECGCGQKAQAHHDDYTKRLEVRWLCKKAHEAVHHPPSLDI